MHKILLIFFLGLVLFPYTVSAEVLESKIGSDMGMIESLARRDCDPEEALQLDPSFTPECYDIQLQLSEEEKIMIPYVRQSQIDIDVEAGDRVQLYTQTDSAGLTTYYIKDYDHLGGIWWLGVLTIIFIIIVGRLKGVRSLIALGVSLSLIFGVLMPLLLVGYTPVWTTLLISVLIVSITLLLINGFSQRTMIILLSTVLGLLVATILAWVFGEVAHLTGFSTEEVRDLVSLKPELDYRGLLFAGMMLGALGAVMDNAVSITSAMFELRAVKNKLTFPELWGAGMGVGYDILGSMINTLIFAYIGSSYAVVFAFQAIGELSLLEILNMGFISEEVVRSLVGAIGLVATIPITAFFCAWFLRHDHPSRR